MIFQAVKNTLFRKSQISLDPENVPKSIFLAQQEFV